MSSGALSFSAESPRGQSVITLPDHFAGAVTGIGSLPFLSSFDGINAVAEHCPEIPFWPQLPRLSDQEGVIGQGLGILRDLVEPRTGGYGYQVKEGRIDAAIKALHNSSGCLTSANAAGFTAFEEAIRRGRFGSALAFKGQIEGPITLATYLFHRDRAFLADASLFAAVAFHIAQIASWQVDRLKALGRPVLIFIDEPALCLEDAISNGIPLERRLSALSAVLDDVRARGAFCGLHCCAARPFSRMCLAKPDVLSFDAHEGLEQFFEDPQALDFVESGGWVAYGMIPNTLSLGSAQPASIFNRWLTAASMAGDPQALAQQAIITSTCGLGLLDPLSVSESFSLAHGVGNLIRRLAGVKPASDRPL
jgi:hypothetical protein